MAGPRGALALFAGRPEDSPALLYLHDLQSEASVRTIRGALDRAARIFDAIDRGGAELTKGETEVSATTYPWGAAGGLTYAKTGAAVARVAKEQRPDGRRKKAQARLMLSALKQIARRAFGLRQLDVAERMAIDDIRAPSLDDSGESKGDRLSPDEVSGIYRVCGEDDSAFGRRDAALIAVGLGGGLRRFEIAALDLADYARPARVGVDLVDVRVRHGKGDKFDVVTMPSDVGAAMDAWLKVRGRKPGPLFCSSPGRARRIDPERRLSVAGVYAVVVERAAEAGIARKVAPHDLRRTAITVFLEQTGDLGLAKKFARHASPTTTARYDHREREAVRKALATARTGFTDEK